VIEHVTLLVVVGALVVARIELAKAVRLLRQRDQTVAAASTALATERAARLRLEADPRTLHRLVVTDVTRNIV
jgi:hypothetical protein